MPSHAIDNQPAINPVILTMGDPAGIGPEITLKAWNHLHRTMAEGFAVIAPFGVMANAAAALNLPAPVAINDLTDCMSIFTKALPIINIDGKSATPGQPSSEFAGTIIQSIDHAVDLTTSGKASAVVTNPISKDILYQAGFSSPGHTEYLDKLTRAIAQNAPRGPVMMLVGGGLRVGLATIHLPLEQAAKSLSAQTLDLHIRVIHHALKRDFGIPEPKIAVAGLNPHAGESGALGREEIEIINPAMAVLRSDHIDVSDAQPADTLFHAEARANYDAALAMYHDQGLIPVKTLDFHGGVNVTLGLPIVRTSPDHGTAFNIAGQNIAREDSLIAAINLAVTLSTNRARYDAG